MGQQRAADPTIPGLTLHRRIAPTAPISYTLGPSLCVIARGAKRVLLGEEVYIYDAQHFLMTSIDVPVVAQILEASPRQPYLGMTLQLDLRAVAQLLVDSHLPPPHVRPARRGMAVSPVSLSLLDAFKRLIDLLDTSEDIPILSPLIQREILYRLLVSERGRACGRLPSWAARGIRSRGR